MVQQPRWDIYEAAILLDGYIEIQQDKMLRKEVIRRISLDLRQMAVNRGIRINETFRNENGISYQMMNMDLAYKREKGPIHTTALFNQLVEIYQTDSKKYYSILKEARSMVTSQKGTKEAFLTWAMSELPHGRSKWIEENIQEVENFAIASKIIYGSIYGVTDKETLERIAKAIRRNKLFIIKNRKTIKIIYNDFDIYIDYCSKFAGKAGMKEEKTPIEDGIAKYTVKSSDSEKNFRQDNVEISINETNRDIIAVLKQHYKYGFKIDSFREYIRFRQFAEEMGIALPEDDDKLKASLLYCGTVIEGKLYYNDNDMVQELRSIVNNIFSSGANVVYYESLFECEQEWMEAHSITSPEMLKKILQKNICEVSFSKLFFSKGTRQTEKEAVTQEIIRVWGDSPIESIYDLNYRLPNIPLENIARVISGNDLFVLVFEGKYLYIERFCIALEDEKAILDFVSDTCEENGFASLNEVPVGNIKEENYELPQFALYNAIYKKTLIGKYYLNGKILTKEKSNIDAIALLKQYISGKDECTFDEVTEKAMELTGAKNRQYVFQALYDKMVRVDINHFVSDCLVSFCVDEIDAVLAEFIHEHFIAIRDVTTFAMFPLCNQNWNHYLLESFCYRYSKKYSLHVINFNDKNVGIIAEKDFSKSYSEMLAIVLSKSNIQLEPELVGRYLFDTGYMAKSKYVNLDMIATQALELRKER